MTHLFTVNIFQRSGLMKSEKGYCFLGTQINDRSRILRRKRMTLLDKSYCHMDYGRNTG